MSAGKTPTKEEMFKKAIDNEIIDYVNDIPDDDVEPKTDWDEWLIVAKEARDKDELQEEFDTDTQNRNFWDAWLTLSYQERYDLLQEYKTWTENMENEDNEQGPMPVFWSCHRYSKACLQVLEEFVASGWRFPG